MVVVDTNILYAVTDRGECRRARCRDWIVAPHRNAPGSADRVAEACYLIDRTLGAGAEAKFLDDVEGAGLPLQLVDQSAAICDAWPSWYGGTPTAGSAEPTRRSWPSANDSASRPSPPSITATSPTCGLNIGQH